MIIGTIMHNNGLYGFGSAEFGYQVYPGRTFCIGVKLCHPLPPLNSHVTSRSYVDSNGQVTVYIGNSQACGLTPILTSDS
jgi:hypothetical protein